MAATSVALAAPPAPIYDYKALFKKAEAWASTHCGGSTSKGAIAKIYFNDSLGSSSCPAHQLFYAAISRLGISSSWDPSEGEFGWHGTKSMKGLLAISWDSWDPAKRSGQANGPGEYFSGGPNFEYSLSYSQNDASHVMIIAWVLSHTLAGAPRTPSANGACAPRATKAHIVCNNPARTSGEMFCIPIAVAAFGTIPASGLSFRTS